MELGISPLVTSGMIMQMLAGAKVITVDQSKREEQELFQAAEKMVGLIITVFLSFIVRQSIFFIVEFGQACLYTLFGKPTFLLMTSVSFTVLQHQHRQK